MKLKTDRGNPLLIAYSAVRSTGFLRSSLGRRLFTSAYFIYKRYVEDDLGPLLHAFPTIIGAENVLDVGANLGYTAVLLARAVKPGRKVYAFEPEPYNFLILEQIASQPELKDRIVPRQLAVGADNGTICLWINDYHHADHRVITEEFRSTRLFSETADVPMVSIDTFLKEYPDRISFVKIDVQGYELAVCQGMQETLRKNPEINIVLEFMPSIIREMGFEPSHLIDFFAERGFKAYQVHPRGRLTPGIPVARNDSDYFDLLFTRSDISRWQRQ